MKRILFLSFSLFFTFQLCAQKPLHFLGLQVKHFGVEMGSDQDMLHNMGRSDLIQTARGNTSEFDGLDFGQQDVTSMTCENPHLRLEVALTPLGIKNTEIRLALLGVYDRIDAVNYFRADAQALEHLHVDVYSNEIGLEGAFLKTSKWKGGFRYFGGVGTNIGYSFGGKINVRYSRSEEVIETGGQAIDDPIGYAYLDAVNTQHYFDQRNGISQRLFVHLGAGFRFFKRVELSLEYRRGIGYRAIFGAPMMSTEYKSAGLALRWLL